MKIEDIRLGMMIRTGLGKVGKVKEINRSGVVIDLPNGEDYGAGFECIEPETCMTRFAIEDIRLGMELVTSGGLRGWVVTIEKEGGLVLETADRTRFQVHVECVRQPDGPHFYCDDSTPLVSLFSTAKCYKQVEPDQLLLSTEARRVVEYMKARDCPLFIHGMLESMENIMSGAAIMDGLIDAREAGIVRLDDGKYSIVRD